MMSRVAWPDADGSLTTRPVLVGTCFSGMEMVSASLRMCQIEHRLRFCCDNNKACKQFILQNFQPDLFLDDANADIAKLPKNLDVYVAGSPCQGFSQANARRAQYEDDIRCKLIWKAVEFAELKKPKAIVLEQVPTLRSPRYRWIFLGIKARLRKAGYSFSYKKLNTSQHGLPQHRPRLYIAAMREDALVQDFKWPKALTEPPPSLRTVLGGSLSKKRKHADIDLATESNTVQRNARWAIQKAKDKGIDLHHTTLVVDAGASERYQHRSVNVMPCVTRARGQGRGYLLMRHAWCRWARTRDVARVQGINFKRYNTSGLSKRQLGAMVGNAMSRNILDRVLPRVLYSVGALCRLPGDKWAAGERPR